ncbi:MAG: GNAT family N-acetyltransferase [Firmicutes bacterium]|nr:GNAT family N-acetyltransferase [Bacillota bacterium]
MIIRIYTAQDEQAAIKLWNASLTEDRINKENFYTRIICDVNFDPHLYLLAEENGELIGFAYGTKRRVPDEGVGLQPENGWLVAMGCSPNHRRKGVGSALVRTLENEFVMRGVKKLDVGAYATNYFFPGVDQKAYAVGVEFFKSLGYADKGICCSMDLNLREYETPARYLHRKAKLEYDGYTFGGFRMENCLPLFDFMNAYFPYWLPNIRENILRGRGEESIQLAWNPKGEVVGFAMRAMDGTPGRFGPFGVANDQQGTGLGGVLFHNLVSDMVERRIFYTWFLWTGGRNLDIYATWGMKVYRSYCMMGKVL